MAHLRLCRRGAALTIARVRLSKNPSIDLGAMHPHQATIEAFYHAFAMLDPETMAVCYAEDARFTDAVFRLRGRREVAAMWHMLCRSVKTSGRQDWKLDYCVLRADDQQVLACWSVRYRFGAQGNTVHNSVQTRFVFDRDGRIVQHEDQFDFWRWSRQALGTRGWLLGWTPMLQHRVRAHARRRLDAYLAQAPGGVLAA